MTKEQVRLASNFHSDGCHVEVGPRGGLTTHLEVWRSSGQFQPRPRKGDWFQPVKHGMYESERITKWSAQYVHDGRFCALDHGWWDGAWLVYRLASDAPGGRPYMGYRVHGTDPTFQVGYFQHGKLVGPQVSVYKPVVGGGCAVSAQGLTWSEAHEVAYGWNEAQVKHPLAS